MAYPHQDQRWATSYNFDISSGCGENQEDQNQAYAIDMSNDMFPNLPSIDTNPRDTALSAGQPSLPLFRWEADGPYFAGSRNQITSAPYQMDNFFSEQSYRDWPRSEGTNSIAGGHDAASVAGSHKFSVGSTEEPSGWNRELPTVERGMERLQPPTKRSRGTTSHRGRPSRPVQKGIRKPSQAVTEGSSKMILFCPSEDCKEVFKLQSELKKHLVWHERPFKCDIVKCDKGVHGFTSLNDLDRHQVTRHGIITSTTKAWCCAVTGCRSRPKRWYRLDNFRQHIHRTHSKNAEEVTRIVADSVVQPMSDLQTPLPQTPDMSTHDTSSGDDGSNVDYTDRPECSGMTLGDDLSPANNWSNFNPDSSFGECSGRGESQSSYRTYSDIDPPLFDQSSYSNPLQSSPSSFTSLSGPGFHRHSFSSSQPRMKNSTTSYPVSQGQPQLVRKSPARPLVQTQTPKVILHQASESDSGVRSQSQEALDLSTKVGALLRRDLPADQLRQSLAKIIQTDNHAGQAGRSLQNNGDRNSSRDVSIPRGRGRPIIHTPSATYISHTDGPRSERTLSQASDRSQSANKQRRMPPQNSSIPNNPYPCAESGCERSFARQSALDKHVKRHQKPYACTFDDCLCSKTFGSKNDWKRHENSQHMQQNLWRCERCFKAFDSKRDFEVHLEDKHGITDDGKVTRICKERRIGVNHSGSFWCGFCTKIIPLSPINKGVAAWDERFNHIAEHFVPGKDNANKQCKIEDWLPPDGRKTKGERENETRPQDDPTPYSATLDDGERVLFPSPNQFEYMSPADANLSPASPSRPVGRSSSTKRKRRGYEATCCQCGMPALLGVHAACPCNHIFSECPTCIIEQTGPSLEDHSPR